MDEGLLPEKEIIPAGEDSRNSKEKFNIKWSTETGCGGSYYNPSYLEGRDCKQL
jgi:hypothetical protein